MTPPRSLLAVTLIGAAFLVAGCGAEEAPDSGAAPVVTSDDVGRASSSTPPSTLDETSPIDPDALGVMIVNERLGVDPANYPLPDLPTQAEVADAKELGAVFGMVPGIDKIAAEVASSPAAEGKRLFAYTTNACMTGDVILEVRGDEVPMIVRGTSTMRCAPPTTLVVWAVGDEVPADAVPAQAILK